jgi:hypothetical protein
MLRKETTLVYFNVLSWYFVGIMRKVTENSLRIGGVPGDFRIGEPPRMPQGCLPLTAYHMTCSRVVLL